MSVVIIAEAGVNHNGDIAQAERLIDVAAEAGADYVKFQTFKAEELVSKDAPKAEYQKLDKSDAATTQLEMLKKLELSQQDHFRLLQYANSRGIKFLSTAFDLESVDFLDQLGVDMFKIPSGEITNYPYLVKIAQKQKPIILSTGMAELKEIEAAMEVMLDNGASRDKIVMLHCNTEYPTPFEDVNLKAMQMMGRHFGVQYGYSDHTIGIEVPIAATALGAHVIEKHFTLDRTLPGPDQKVSLEPHELKAMVMAIRNIEKAMSGTGIKSPSPSEQKNIAVVRKSIYLNQDIDAGQVLEERHLIMKRPGDGISPMELKRVVGSKARVSLKKGSKLSWNDISR